MDIENLSKTDVIFMALFISFMTAMATAIVVIFLMEDAPREVVQIRERFISTEATSSMAASSSDTGTATGSDAVEDAIDYSRDEILQRAVLAVARITSSNSTPQAGVLIVLDGRDVVVTQSDDFSTDVRALFEDGVVADLEDVTANESVFSLLQVTAASDGINPLRLSDQDVLVGDSAYIVPLSERPEIIRVSVTAIQNRQVTTSAGNQPSTSLLFTDNGGLIGVYNSESGAFQDISGNNLIQ